jgi:hypothetical protein
MPLVLELEIRAMLRNGDFRIASCAFAATEAAGERELTCELRWRARPDETQVP